MREILGEELMRSYRDAATKYIIVLFMITVTLTCPSSIKAETCCGPVHLSYSELYSKSERENISVEQYEVTVLSARIFSERDQSSRVYFDVPNSWPLYAEKTSDPKWLKVYGVGSKPYTVYISSSNSDGNSLPSKPTYKPYLQRYFKENGYILAEEVETTAELNDIAYAGHGVSNGPQSGIPAYPNDKVKIAKYSKLSEMYERSHKFESYGIIDPYGSLDTGILSSLRVLCLFYCRKQDFENNLHLTETVGQRFSAREGDFYFEVGGHYGAGESQTKLEIDKNSDVRFYLVGGDAFLVKRSDMIIRGIIRNIMMLQSVQDQKYNRFFCEACQQFGMSFTGTSLKPTRQLRQAQFKAETPFTVPSAKIIMPPEMFKSMSTNNPVIVTTLPYSFGLTRTIKVTDLAGPGSFYDNKQSDLSERLRSATNGDKSRLIVVYGMGTDDWDAYNVVLRAERLGYKNVSWMRMGMNGWIWCGLPLSVIQ